MERKEEKLQVTFELYSTLTIKLQWDILKGKKISKKKSQTLFLMELFETILSVLLD